MKILVKGAGDLATGIGWRLKRAGYRVWMTDLEVPTAVRRTVAFSRAIYEGEARVEGILSCRVSDMKEAEEAEKAGKIPVFADPEAEIRALWQPEVVVDGILAKKNLGTRMTDAPLVIGVGPGFTAGTDCHCVIETKRGHYLGRVIDKGSAIPNTGVPGNVGGYTVERLLRAADSGIFRPLAEIGDYVTEGQTVALVGPTGAGKTTMVKLLMRFYDVQSGSIKIGGHDIRDFARDDLRSMFGMVLQDTWLFEGTVRENLAYNLPGVTDAQLETVCRACGLDKFVHSLPEGFDTVLSESTSISAGQKQLLTIARAMLQNAPMLILDEATSSVDTRTELLIQRAMDQLTEDRTSFVIAHRLSTIKNADLILVMKDGDVIESGTHDTLMQQGGFYAALYNSQFEQAS